MPAIALPAITTDRERRRQHRPAVSAAPSGGRGLLALSERVRLLGGELTIDDTGTGFRLTAHLPDAAVHAGALDAPAAPPLEEQLQAGRQRARSSLATAMIVPLGALSVLALAMTGYFVYATLGSVLPPGDLAQIRIGQPQEEAQQLLPSVQMLDAPADSPPPPPPGADCRYYEAEVSFFDRRDVHRICFADGRVVAADVIPPRPPADVVRDAELR